MNALKEWIKSKPGPFAGRTHDEVWDSAFRNFCAGPTGQIGSELRFRLLLQQAGFGVRALATGGYALDQVT